MRIKQCILICGIIAAIVFTMAGCKNPFFPEKMYTVTFDSNDGTAVKAVTLSSGSKITLPEAPTKAGYNFGGWYKEAALTNEWDFDVDTVNGDMTLYAKWTINGYTVTFNANGGLPAPELVSANYGSRISAPAAMSRDGYTFAGWYKEAELINVWDFAVDTVNGDTILYAKWKPEAQIEIKYGNTVINPSDVYDFENIYYGGYKEIEFTITNTGTADLSLIDVDGNKVNLSETDAFEVSQPDAASIAPGNSATFKIKFYPPAQTDTFSSTVSIQSNSQNNAEFSFSVKGTELPFEIGDTGPAGGIVFYDKGNSDGGWRYLEAAPKETEFQTLWIPYGVLSDVGTQTEIGTGKENTRIIVDDIGITEAIFAAQFCDSLDYGGYDDWFMPSKDELDLIHNNLKLKGLGNFENNDYWSSSQYNNSNAWYQSFSGGGQFDDGWKNSSKYVRAIRAF